MVYSNISVAFGYLPGLEDRERGLLRRKGASGVIGQAPAENQMNQRCTGADSLDPNRPRRRADSVPGNPKQDHGNKEENDDKTPVCS